MSAAAPPAASRAPSRPLWPLLPSVAALVLVVTTVSFLAPLLIALSGDLGVSVEAAGALVVATALPWALVAPFSGLLSDRFGRRPVILTALIGMGTATIAGAFAGEFWILVALRLLTGAFGSGGPPTIMAGLIDYYPPHQRGTAIGSSNASFSLAALAMVPLIGAIGGIWGWRAAFVVTGTGMLAVAALIWFFYPRAKRGGAGAGHPIRAYGYLVRLPHLATLLGSNLLERVTFMVFSLYLATFLIQTYRLDPVSVAPALSAAAIGGIVGALGGGLFADRVNRTALAASMLALSGVCGLAVFAWPGEIVVSVGAGFGFGLSNAASRPPFMSLLLGLTDQHRGALNGLVAMSNQFGWAIGAGIGGLILGWVGFPGLGQFLALFALGSAGLVIVARSIDRPDIATIVARSRQPAAPPPTWPEIRPAPAVVESDRAVASPRAWVERTVAAERSLAADLADRADRATDPELAEALAVAAGRARDRAFRLARAAGASMPAAGSFAGARSTGRDAGPETLTDLIDRPGLYVAAPPGLPPAVARVLPDLAAGEAATCDLLADLRDRIRRDRPPVRRVSLRTRPGDDPHRAVVQFVCPINRQDPDLDLVRIAQAPGAAVRLEPRSGSRLIYFLNGRGQVRQNGSSLAVESGRLIALPDEAIDVVTSDTDSLVYLVFGRGMPSIPLAKPPAGR